MGRVTVSIRGAEPRHTLILIDGQPVMGDFAKYSGQADELQRLGTENVDHIEIIQGAASAKYGSDAIGGVINVVTKKAAKTPGLQINAEGRRTKGDGDLFPYQNFFLRADSGQVGKARFSVYGSKREILPVYSKNSYTVGDVSLSTTVTNMRNSLRYYGDIKNIGFMGSVDLNDRNTIDFSMDKTSEDMERLIKHTDSGAEPRQQFKRTVDRNTWRMSYKGNNGSSTDWKIDVDYAKMNEDDITLLSYFANDPYQGKNYLKYVDDLEHKQWNVKASANTQLNDKHLLTYGFGFSKETGEGSRIKNAPDSYVRTIDPWDYDKNLYVPKGSGEPMSLVHDYPIIFGEDGVPRYDYNMEVYGSSQAPAFTYEDSQTYLNMDYLGMAFKTEPSDEVLANLHTMAEQFRKENPTVNFGGTSHDTSVYPDGFIAYLYYIQKAGTLNGKNYREEFNLRNNQVRVGRAEIKKQYFYLGDTWQVNDNTILSPVFRVDHSDLFGSNATFNLGLTHNLGGNQHRRFKANVGTGYTEPGMGELYYNWEMYAGMPVGFGVGKLGHYWIGNPNLKPEKSVNFDIGIEGENGNTSARLNVFHNKIDDYMTTYYTGYILDFNPEMQDKWLQPPDMIYSFKNIGKAEITGVEAEVNHKFGDHWSGKLGYTYLHAVNKSDPDMPDQLLNKPQHKVDIGVTYENAGWTASLWGDYYIHMLDSNSVSGNRNYWIDGEGYVEGGKEEYQKKTFGLWNFLLSKQIDKDSTVYVGVDNLFNHRDDDQAFMERVYKFGVNLKFGPGGETLEKELDKAAGKAVVEDTAKTLDTDWFIQQPFDTEKEQGIEVIGDYRARWNVHGGTNRPAARTTQTASVGDAAKNLFDSSAHGFEQRLRLGLDARIGENTNVKILGSASGMTGVDTMHDVSDSKGLNHQRLDNVDITQHANKWDFSIGRLTEPMGVTGYWFGKEYDGARAVWTSGNTQVRLGYGDFSASTGITDSAYTHATKQLFWRTPTKDEWLGFNMGGNENPFASALHNGWFGDGIVQVPGGYKGLYQQLASAASLEEQKQLLDSYLQIIKTYGGPTYEDAAGKDTITQIYDNTYTMPLNTFAWQKVTVKNGDTVLGTYLVPVSGGTKSFTYDDSFKQDVLQQAGEDLWNQAESNLEQEQTAGTLTVRGVNGSDTPSSSLVLNQGTYTIDREFYGYGRYTGNAVIQTLGTSDGQTIMGFMYQQGDANGDIQFFDTTNPASAAAKEQARQEAVTSLWKAENGFKTIYGQVSQNSSIYHITGKAPGADISYAARTALEYLYGGLYNGWWPENYSTMPLQFLAQLGVIMPYYGTVLVQDQIPSIDRAAFIQAKHQFGDHFGVQAWYLRSTGDDRHTIAYANGDQNDTASFDDLANVIGLGAKYRFGRNASISFDWGQNRTDFGRFMNGSTIYTHTAGTSDFSIDGRTMGGTPRFWTVRFDIGKADTDVPGSWNAFADYKYFEHGSFFGGNGTEGVPDRYLDGIKSFTIGGGYVPAKDVLLEAFYTFGAKGIGTRDTLYGSEHFELGDYTRLQATFKF